MEWSPKRRSTVKCWHMLPGRLHSSAMATAFHGLPRNKQFEELTMFFLRRRFINIMLFIWAIMMVLSLATARADIASPVEYVEPSRVGLHVSD